MQIIVLNGQGKSVQSGQHGSVNSGLIQPAVMGGVIEVKYAHDRDMNEACKETLRQIEYTSYENELSDDGVENILKYGIACYKNGARVMLVQV